MPHDAGRVEHVVVPHVPDVCGAQRGSARGGNRARLGVADEKLAIDVKRWRDGGPNGRAGHAMPRRAVHT